MEPAIQRVPKVPSPDYEDDHSPPFNANIKNKGNYTSNAK